MISVCRNSQRCLAFSVDRHCLCYTRESDCEYVFEFDSFAPIFVCKHAGGETFATHSHKMRARCSM